MKKKDINPPFAVICLCAEWCGTCVAYASVFQEVAAQRPELDFHWLDVEDDCARYPALEDMEIDNFPTLLLAHGEEVRFFGTVLPHKETLTRLLENYVSLEQASDSTAAITANAAEGSAMGTSRAHAHTEYPQEIISLLRDLPLTQRRAANEA